MAKEQKLKAYSMWLDGASLREIGKEIGVSHESVRKNLPELRYKPSKVSRECVYSNVSAWMEKTDTSAAKMASQLGTSYNALYKILLGHTCPTMKTINKILKLTGMTYEEAFAKEDGYEE